MIRVMFKLIDLDLIEKWENFVSLCYGMLDIWSLLTIKTINIIVYRSGTLNSKTVNSKFHFIRSLKFWQESYHFMFKMYG